MNNYIVSSRVNHDLKEISVTARDPEISGCQVINIHGRCKLRWDQTNTNPNHEEDDWEIFCMGLTRNHARKIKKDILKNYVELGYTVCEEKKS